MSSIERKNLFLNPRFVETGRQPLRVFDCERLIYQWGDRCAFAILSKTNSIGPFVEWVSAPLEAGKDYVFRIEIGYNHSGEARGAIVNVASMNYAYLVEISSTKPAERVQELRFTAPTDGPVLLQFRGVNTNDGNQYSGDPLVAFYDPQLELAETYDAAKASNGAFGPLFFTGDTMAQRAGGDNMQASDVIWPDGDSIELGGGA